MAYTGRYESKSHELPVAFDDCSDKEAFIEDCKVVQLLLICFLPKMVGRFHSILFYSKAAAEEGSEAHRKLYWFQVKCFQVDEIIFNYLQFFAIICNLMQSVDRNGDEVMCNQFDDRNNWK